MRIATVLTLALLVVIAGASTGHAIPHLINYQGILTDDLGNPTIDETTVDFRRQLLRELDKAMQQMLNRQLKTDSTPQSLKVVAMGRKD